MNNSMFFNPGKPGPMNAIGQALGGGQAQPQAMPGQSPPFMGNTGIVPPHMQGQGAPFGQHQGGGHWQGFQGMGGEFMGRPGAGQFGPQHLQQMGQWGLPSPSGVGGQGYTPQNDPLAAYGRR